MTHYRTNLRDLEFNLFEANRIQDYLGSAPFGDIDEATARALLEEVERLAVEDFAASFVEADRTPLRLEDGEVILPDGVKRSLDAFFEGGWDRFGMPESMGGAAPPPSLRWAAQELLVGANPAAYFYVIGGLMAWVIEQLGTADQIERFGRRMLDRRWGGSMVLTEPDAGSDVGAGTTKAHLVDGSIFHIEGVKRFITSGEADYSENIIHLVLARPDGAGPGTKGLSMFIVPKYLVNDDGSLGERNGVVATRLADKMGIKGSTTAELTFGADRPCVGYLVGGVHSGIRQMFKVIEEARMLIGAKSTATLSTGYLNALAYAAERHQGADLAEAHDPEAPRVPIIDHPNVRRLLMQQKAHVEGMRALVQYAAWSQDQGALHPEDPYWEKLADLLLPLVKGFSSERAYVLLAQSLQVFGGSGFTREYPIEQYIRDAKIDTVYEGTTGIQALDLFFRKIARDRGETLVRFAEEIRQTVKAGTAEDSLADERDVLGSSLEDVQAMLGAMVGDLMAAATERERIYRVGLHANALLEGLAEVVIGWLLIRHADIALAALADEAGEDRAFYEGKVASARWFVRNVLPRSALRRRLAETEDGSLMTMDDAAF